jgi:hypothetical protein
MPGPRAKDYGGGLVGAYGPRRPAETRRPDSYPDKPAPPPGQITPNLQGGASPRGTDRQPVSLPGFNFAPPGAYPVDESDDAAIAPGAQATLIKITVPNGLMLSLYGIGFDSFDPIALSFLTWSLLRNGQPDRVYTNQAAVIGSVREPSKVIFFAPNQVEVTLVLTVAAASPATYQFVARAQGYFYSEEAG